MNEEQPITTAGEADNNALSKDFNAVTLLKFAFPTIVMMVFFGFYTIVDTIFVSRFVNTNALSAIIIVCPIINIIVGFATMLAVGGGAVVARKMGSGNEEEAKKYFTLIICLGAFIGLLIGLTGLLFLEHIIRGLGASDVLFPYCRDYLIFLLIFAPANIMQCLYVNLFVTSGKPGLGLWLSVSAGLTNIVLDFVFIVLMQMGIRGAAVATCIGYMIPTIAGTYFFAKNKGSLSFVRPKFDIKVIRESCFNGSSEMVSQLSTAITTFLFNITMMKLLGDDGVAAVTIIINSQFLLTTIYIGFSLGVTPVISYNYGSRNHTRLKRVFRICTRFIFISSVLIFAVSMFGGSYISNIFAGRETNVYKITKYGFSIFSFSFLFRGFNIFASAMFIALSNGKVSAAVSFLRTLGFITAGLLILPVFLNVTGIWLAVPLAELLALFVSATLILKYRNLYGYL
jgi:putative MATE family efflux protein